MGFLFQLIVDTIIHLIKLLTQLNLYDKGSTLQHKLIVILKQQIFV